MAQVWCCNYMQIQTTEMRQLSVNAPKKQLLPSFPRYRMHVLCSWFKATRIEVVLVQHYRISVSSLRPVTTESFSHFNHTWVAYHTGFTCDKQFMKNKHSLWKATTSTKDVFKSRKTVSIYEKMASWAQEGTRQMTAEIKIVVDAVPQDCPMPSQPSMRPST